MGSTCPNEHVKSRQRKIMQSCQRTQWLLGSNMTSATEGAAKMSKAKIQKGDLIKPDMYSTYLYTYKQSRIGRQAEPAADRDRAAGGSPAARRTPLTKPAA